MVTCTITPCRAAVRLNSGVMRGHACPRFFGVDSAERRSEIANCPSVAGERVGLPGHQPSRSSWRDHRVPARLVLRSLAYPRFACQSRRITIHSSRHRFAARLNSGVRPSFTNSLLKLLEKFLWNLFLDRSCSFLTTSPRAPGHLVKGTFCMYLSIKLCLV